MARPCRCRRIKHFPDYWTFNAEGNESDAIILSLDEYETIRLIDFEKRKQEECAESMGVSRTTVTAIYDSARSKLARHIIEGRPLRISGGSYRIVSDIKHNLKIKGDNTMRVAMTYENGMVGQHFGRSEYFMIYDVEDGNITNEQIVSTDGQGHGALAGVLKELNADVLICGGIGMGARMGLDELGIELIPGTEGKCDDVIDAYLKGNLTYDIDKTCEDHEHNHDCHNDGGCCH